MPLNGAAMSLMLRKGNDRRREDELWKAFNEADTNKDGYLSVEEYIQVFRNHGISVTTDEVMQYFNSKDRDRDGRISFEEFCDRATINEKAFKAMDINGDGFVSKSEMLLASNRSHRRLSAADVENCFREFDKDKDNKLSYDEFCQMMNTRRHTLDLFIDHHNHHVVKRESLRKMHHKHHTTTEPTLSPIKSPQDKYLVTEEVAQAELDKLSVNTTDTSLE